MTEKKRNIIRCNDLNCAAYILCQEGVRLEGAVPREDDARGRLDFLLELPMNVKAKTLIMGYFNGKALVNPRQFVEQQRMLWHLVKNDFTTVDGPAEKK